MKLLLATLLLLAAPVAEQRYFHFVRDIAPSPESAPATCVEVPAQVRSQAAAGLPDARIYRGDAQVPFAASRMESAVSGAASMQPLNLGTREGRTEFEADLHGGAVQDVSLSIAGTDFLADVTVSGVEDGKPVRVLGTFPVFDFSRSGLGRSTVLHLPRTDFQRLRFSIRGNIAPDRIGSLSVEAPASETRYAAVAQSSAVSVQGRESHLVVDVPANVDVERLTFAVDAGVSNFNRKVSVRAVPLTGEDREQEPRFFSGSILRVHDTQDRVRIDVDQLSPPISSGLAAAPSRWNISVSNGDDAPLPITAVQVEAVRTELCFRGGGSGFRLMYGDTALDLPSYDLTSPLHLLAGAAHVSPGEERPNALFTARPDERPFTERHPALLWVALAGVIVGLGGVALRSRNQVTP